MAEIDAKLLSTSMNICMTTILLDTLLFPNYVYLLVTTSPWLRSFREDVDMRLISIVCKAKTISHPNGPLEE
ncbi:hypothetical protein KC318_g11 [Hortaea werneckii]|nr:hypothetical protein KC334_g11 [Hortaea werneckii]KAI7028349.1 hypothetical protein KC355_g12 [Hortaea werneckii]KAI7676787.1 hypothetical protein KC318_g11 [Hortaea werneckii]